MVSKEGLGQERVVSEEVSGEENGVSKEVLGGGKCGE